MFLSKYGVARHIYIPIIKRAVVDYAVGADWTPAAGDVKISKDGGAAVNVTNLPVAIVMGNGAVWDFSMTATEMQAAQVTVTVVDSATKAVEDQSFDVETYGNASAQHAFDLAAANVTVGAVAAGAITNAAFAAGAIDNAAIATDAIGSAELATSAITEIQTGLSTLDAAGVRAAVGLASANTDTQFAAVATLIGAVPTATQNADALLKRDMSAVSGEAARSPLNALRKLMNKWSIAGTVLSVFKEDDTTAAYTQNITSSAGADPVTGLDTV